MNIQFLYFDDCPSYKTALALLQEALSALDRSGEIELIEIKDEADVERWQFIGSPSIRINGIDLFDRGTASIGLECRVYNTPDGLLGWPTKAMLMEALTQITDQPIADH